MSDTFIGTEVKGSASVLDEELHPWGNLDLLVGPADLLRARRPLCGVRDSG